MRIVLLIALCILQFGIAMAQEPQRPVEIDSAACKVLDDAVKPADRYLEIVLPHGDTSGVRKVRPAKKINLNVRIPHSFAAADDIMQQMQSAMREHGRIDPAERLKLALALGCRDNGMEYVSYRMTAEQPRLRLPIKQGTPFPLDVSVCVRTEEGPYCFYGTFADSNQTSVEVRLEQ
jgi:hypothetical protein